MAFAEGRSDIYKVSIPRGGSREPWEQQREPAGYRGELSAGAQRQAYISTKDNSEGDVYVTVSDPDGVRHRRITCDNKAAEFHPVISPDGTMLAYASDEKGNLDIWIAGIGKDAKDCPQARQLTSSEASDSWPTWVPDSSAVIFSSGREDPLGDLFQLPAPDLNSGTERPLEVNLLQLTAGPDADTQPAAYRPTGRFESSGSTWVIFTTTLFEQSGSLAILELPSAGAKNPQVLPVWPAASDPGLRLAQGYGSSEAAWSPNGDWIAFTSIRDDPGGDVLIAALNFNNGAPEIDPSRVVKAAASPGTSESHAAWLADGDNASLGFTSRRAEANISDANAFDGGAQRVIAAAALDDAGPAYSPEGTSIVWSQEVSHVDGGIPRVLFRSDADGQQAGMLNYERGDKDVDVDPVWSPDGRRIAFTRYAWTGRDYSDPAAWTVDLGMEREEGARAPSRRVSAPAPEGVRYAEENPSWSPDGLFLAVDRRYAPDLQVNLKTSGPVRVGQEISAEANVTNVGKVTTDPTEIKFTFPAGVTVASIPDGCVQGRGQIMCRVGILAPGADSVHSWTLRGDTPGGWELAAQVLQPGDSNQANNQASAMLLVSGNSDLEVDVKATLRFLYDDSTKVYDGVLASATVTNLGELQADASTLTFTTDGNLTLPSECSLEGPCTGKCVAEKEAVTCPIEALAPGASATREIVLKGLGTGKDTVTAKVSKDAAEISTVNNTAVAVVPIPSPTPTTSPPQQPQIGLRFLSLVSAAPDVSKAGILPAQSLLTLSPPPEPISSPPELWVLNAASGEGNPLAAPGRCVAECAVTGTHPAWSPDGTRIVVTDGGMLQGVTLKDDDGSNGPDFPHAAASIAAVTGFDAAGTPTASRWQIRSAEDPAWAPDGTEIYFTGQPAGQPDHRGIFAIAPDGSKVRAVVQGRRPETQPALQSWADLAIKLAGDPVTIPQGNTAMLKASVVNTGPSPAAAGKVLIEVPEGMTAQNTTADGCEVSARSVQCNLDERLDKAAAMDIVVEVRSDAAGEHVSTATVTAGTPDPRPADNQAATSTRTLSTRTPGGDSSDIAVELSLKQSEGWTGGQPATATAKVTNNGPATASGISIKADTTGPLTFERAGECGDAGCPMDNLDAGASREVELKFGLPESDQSGGVSARSAEISVEASTSSTDPKLENNKDSEGFTVRQPGVTVYPAVAKPGDVVTVVVEGLPPGAAVKFAWSKGIPPDPTAINHNGTDLRRGVLLVRRDQLGTRDIIVTSGGQEKLFGEIRANMLVVARPVAPMPDFIGRG
ncbi:DUF11 domain-containing protein [Arthrobacter sp. SLBN-112]|uniref:DUF11 domain-containing protein n=1 Tax=Arthrobacter sp. SLBN-112 TaxID=2768452 RepID=UPI0013568080|nr:DUF11 domain-containing protein [Arthrobacter sp. SLBN-112]